MLLVRIRGFEPCTSFISGSSAKSALSIKSRGKTSRASAIFIIVVNFGAVLLFSN